jgi:hypothetical protein
MARYRGRVIVKKVGEDGKKINGSLASWKKKNPGKMVFDSMPEYEAWKYMKKHKINFEYQPNIDLFPPLKTKEFKNGKLKDATQRKIGYTPDYYLKDFDIYIEVKGYADDLFKLRWKLFKLKGYKGYIVYSLEELKTLIALLQE